MASEKVKEKSAYDRPLYPITATHPTTGRDLEVDYAKDVQIGRDVERELRELPGKMAWFMSLRDRAADDLRDAQFREYSVEEDLYVAMKNEAVEKTSETELKNRVKTHTMMREAFRRRNEAEKRYKHVSSVVDLMIEKRWALMTLVKFKIAEMSSGLGEGDV